MYNNLNTNEFGCTLYDIVNCLLSDYRTISNGKDIYIYIYIYMFKMLYWAWCTNICKYMLLFNH